MKYVLDTNIVTRLLKGDERVLGHLADVEPSDVGIPLLVRYPVWGFLWVITCDELDEWRGARAVWCVR